MQMSLLSESISERQRSPGADHQGRASDKDEQSSYGVEVLEGLLAGPASMVRRGEAARISVVIPAAAGDPTWRIENLRSEFAALELSSEITTTVGGQAVVRTEFAPSLLRLASQWARGATKAPPPSFALDGPKLRLWAIAAGHSEAGSYQFGLAEHDTAMRGAVEKALRAAGLTVTLVGHRAGGPAFRCTGRKRLDAVRTLIGPPPPEADWP